MILFSDLGANRTCAENICEQNCTQLSNGGFICSCSPGFKSSTLDRNSCQGRIFSFCCYSEKFTFLWSPFIALLLNRCISSLMWFPHSVPNNEGLDGGGCPLYQSTKKKHQKSQHFIPSHNPRGCHTPT